MKQIKIKPQSAFFDNFCPGCEKHNKAFPEFERETFYDGLFCPRCNPIKRKKVSEVIKELEEKYQELKK